MTISPIKTPLNRQLVDPSTGKIREEWGIYLDRVTSRLNATVATVGGVEIHAGAGAPAIPAPKGSLYLRTDGSSTSTRVYVNTNGATGWTNLVSAT